MIVSLSLSLLPLSEETPVCLFGSVDTWMTYVHNYCCFPNSGAELRDFPPHIDVDMSMFFTTSLSRVLQAAAFQTPLVETN